MILGWAEKEFRHHALPLYGLVAIACFILVTAIEVLVTLERPELMVVPVGAVIAGAPLYGAFVAGRLFVLEHEKKTFPWLAALPQSLVRIGVWKGLLGLLIVSALPVLLFGLSHALLSHREWLPFPFVARLTAQACAYSWLWFGIAVLIAQLGRYRKALWVFVALSWVSTLTTDGQGGHLFGASALSIEHWSDARFDLPWTGVAVASGLGLGLVLIAIALLSYQGGAVVARLHRPATRRQKSLIFFAAFAGIFLPELFGASTAPVTADVLFLDPGDPGTVGAPDAPWLKPHQDALATQLRGLGTELDIDHWPSIALVELVGPSPRPAEVRRDGRLLLVEVRRGADPADTLYAAMPQIAEHMWPVAPLVLERHGWLVTGFITRWLARRGVEPPRWLLERAALARAWRGAAAGWPELRRHLGADVSLGLAWDLARRTEGSCPVDAQSAFVREALPARPITEGYQALFALLGPHPAPAPGCALRVAAVDAPAPIKAPTQKPPAPDTVPNANALAERRLRLAPDAPPDLELWSVGYASPVLVSAHPQPTSRIAQVVPGSVLSLPHRPSEQVWVTAARAMPAIAGYAISGWKELSR